MLVDCSMIGQAPPARLVLCSSDLNMLTADVEMYSRSCESNLVLEMATPTVKRSAVLSVKSSTFSFVAFDHTTVVKSSEELDPHSFQELCRL